MTTATNTPGEKTSVQSPTEQPSQNESEQSGVIQRRFVDRWDTNRSWAGGVALLAILGTFWSLSGLVGVAVWLILVASWFIFPAIVPFALGYLGLVAMAPETSLTVTLPAQVSLVGLLLASIVSQDRSLSDIARFTATAIIIAAIIHWSAKIANLIIAATVGMGLFCLASYFLHRYLPLTLGIVDDIDSSE